jgi:very-short-patch-repair endonuclease
MARRLLIARARDQRQNMADCEKRLWHILRSRRYLGYKFRRRVPIGPFIADFECISARLVIEVDGDSHGNDAQEARDAERTRWLESRGWHVLRFWTGDLTNMDEVTERIFEEMEALTPTLSRKAGEGDPSALG